MASGSTVFSVLYIVGHNWLLRLVHTAAVSFIVYKNEQ